MINNGLEYNTERKQLIFGEYGRSVQAMVEHLLSIENRAERTRKAHTVVAVMANLNPAVKETEDYKHKLWDHLYLMSNLTLDVDGPYEKPEAEKITKKPDVIPYPGSPIKYRYYGRNCQNMVKYAADMETGQNKSDFIDLLASFMKNSSKNWNNEILAQEAITEHLSVMSDGKLQLTPEELTIYEQQQRKKKFNNGGGGGFHNSNNRNNFQQNRRGNFGGNRNNKFRKHK